MLHKLKTEINELRFYLSDYFTKKKQIYRLDKTALMDVYQTKKLVLTCRGLKSVFRYDIGDIIDDYKLLSLINPIDTNTIGVIVGKLLHSRCQSITQCYYQIKDNRESIYNKGDRYKYSYYRQRTGIISFIDTIAGKNITEDPRVMSMDHKLLSKFSPIQTFFIGIDAGYLDAKEAQILQKGQISTGTPNLYVIKNENHPSNNKHSNS